MNFILKTNLKNQKKTIIKYRLSRNSEDNKRENIYENGLWVDTKPVKIEE